MRRLMIAAFALCGLAATSASTYVHYRLAASPEYASFCDVSANVNCTEAYLSPYGSFLGAPVALEGMIFFGVVLLLAAAARPGSAPAPDAWACLLVLSVFGLAFSAYLAWASYVVLNVFCILCATTYASVLALFVTALGAERTPMTALPSRAARDLRTLVARPRALAGLVLFAAAAVAALTAFPEAAPPPAPPQSESLPPLTPELRSKLEAWWNVQPRVELPIAPSTGVKVQIVMFSDYQCPGCRAAHETLRRILPRYDRTAVEFVLKHYPLEPECNPNVPQGNHLAACEAAAAYVMARGSGFQQKLDDWLFEHQSTLTRDAVRKAALDIAGIKDFDARYERALQEVKTDAGMGGFVQVRSTPTVFLNSRMIAGNGRGLLPAEHVDALVDLELKKAK